MLEKQYHDELKMEIDGITFSNLSNKKVDKSPDTMDKDDTNSDHEEDEKKQAQRDSADISKALMSRKKLGLYEAMEVCVLKSYVLHHVLTIFYFPAVDCSTSSIK
jgi:pescadillo protein